MIQAAQRYEENAVQIDLDGIFVLFEVLVGDDHPQRALYAALSHPLCLSRHRNERPEIQARVASADDRRVH